MIVVYLIAIVDQHLLPGIDKELNIRDVILREVILHPVIHGDIASLPLLLRIDPELLLDIRPLEELRDRDLVILGVLPDVVDIIDIRHFLHELLRPHALVERHVLLLEGDQSVAGGEPEIGRRNLELVDEVVVESELRNCSELRFGADESVADRESLEVDVWVGVLDEVFGD